jgi:hypothetical protein
LRVRGIEAESVKAQASADLPLTGVAPSCRSSPACLPFKL